MMMAASTETQPGLPVLALRQLSVSLQLGRKKVELVHGIDLDLHPGEVVGLVGESGSGKSLTAHALLGLLPPSTSEVRSERFEFNGTDLATAQEAQWQALRGRHLAMIFQDPQASLDPVLTIGQQMRRVIRRHLPLVRREAHFKAAAALAECGLGDAERVLRCYPHELSGGMRQRVMIAMALGCGPELLVADEATSALDISSRGQVLVLLRGIADRHGTAVLLISHDLAAVARICDRLMVMYAGRIVESGATRPLLQHPRHPYTAGLWAASPRVTAGLAVPVQPIAGRVHALHEELPGCAFAPRCPNAGPDCRLRQPPLEATGAAGHLLACHHPVMR